MNYEELQFEIKKYRGALLAESLVSGPKLRRASRTIRFCVYFALGCVLFLFLFSRAEFFARAFPSISSAEITLFPIAASLFYLAFALWLLCASFYAFYVSYYFKDIDVVLREFNFRVRPKISYAVAASMGKSSDVLLDFFSSRFGMEIAFRLGISSADVTGFLTKRTKIISTETFEIQPSRGEEIISLRALAEAVLRESVELKRFLSSREISETDFVETAAWVGRNEENYKRFLRFWSRDALGRMAGIGKNWAYGETSLLERYAVEIIKHSSFSAFSGVFGKREAEDIERILSRGREANVMLIGEDGVPKIAAIAWLARNIISGSILPPLEHKRIFIFDGALFASAMKEKSKFENELIRLLLEAKRAGNIIFVFDNFHTLFSSAASMNSDVLSLIDPFLISSNIQIVAIAEVGAFHQLLEPNPKIRERFELVQIAGIGASAMIPALQDEAIKIENRERIFFTYQAIRALAESASRYFSEGVMTDKAMDLLLEIAPDAKISGNTIIKKEDVFRLVSRKTGIAVGAASGEEKNKLLRLEEILHERIVGQDEAIKAIAGALRRARAGVGNPNRPMGSFLFLGPTGVGKTETTKALAHVMFGDEKMMTRFDMSEFQTDDALNRLIGMFGAGKAGVLASALRERPFGVLLLDEFEKTNTDIHHLFLQILDEGFFTDAKGSRVNARNLMIVATSNAGSDLIWNAVQKGVPLKKDAVVTEIINRGIFKPELLNRFDGVILFHPLKEEHLRIIARLQLEKLAKRLLEKGLELIISDPLLDYLVSVGQDPKFGARPMNRAIADKVEQKIADKLLRGEIVAGSRVELSEDDLK